MSIEEKDVFCTVIEKFRKQYPKRRINIVGDGKGNEFLTVDDEIKFNTTGYNLLYNLKRLCDVLQDELI